MDRLRAALTPGFVIPAGATGVQSQINSGITTPASCIVTETANGARTTVAATVTGSPQTATISPGGSGAAHITDTYGAAPESLLVTKPIAGERAGQQGTVMIQVVCNDSALSPDFVIPAGSLPDEDELRPVPAPDIPTTRDGSLKVTKRLPDRRPESKVRSRSLSPAPGMTTHSGCRGR